MILGIASFVLFVLGHLFGIGDSLTRIVVPGKGEVELRDAGKYIIFHEYESVVGDIAIAIVVVIFVKRRKSKKQIESLGANPDFPTASPPGMR